MDTSALIDAADAAKAAFDEATTSANIAVTTLQQAAATMQAANQALHDDLAANGPAVRINDTVSPPTVTLYTAVDPDDFAATPIREA
jgi:hypothetical protein